MVEKVVINETKECPIGWISEVKALKKGTEIVFKPGVNIIVGENGSGKSTLMTILRRYLLVGDNECDTGQFNCVINNITCGRNYDAIDVYADYKLNTFRLSHVGEKPCRDPLENFDEFGTMMTRDVASTGEGVMYGLSALFGKMFSQGAKLKFDYEGVLGDVYPDYLEYIRSHRVKGDEWTILMDEPDRNLSIGNLKQIASILSHRKEHTQIIAVIHNPLIIYRLKKKCKDINWIELTNGYSDAIVSEVDKMTGVNRLKSRKTKKAKE